MRRIKRSKILQGGMSKCSPPVLFPSYWSGYNERYGEVKSFALTRTCFLLPFEKHMIYILSFFMSEKKVINMSKNEIHDLTMKYLDKRILSRIWLSFWTLFLEFGKLDEDGNKWEVSFMIQPSRRFQSGYQIRETSDWSKEDLEKSLNQYVWKRLRHCVIDDYLHELRLDFWDVYLATLGTFNWDRLWWILFFNEHGNNIETDPINWTMISSDKEWIHFSKIDK